MPNFSRSEGADNTHWKYLELAPPNYLKFLYISFVNLTSEPAELLVWEAVLGWDLEGALLDSVLPQPGFLPLSFRLHYHLLNSLRLPGNFHPSTPMTLILRWLRSRKYHTSRGCLMACVLNPVWSEFHVTRFLKLGHSSQMPPAFGAFHKIRTFPTIPGRVQVFGGSDL